MAPGEKKANTLQAVLDVTKSTQDLVTHFQSSLAPSKIPTASMIQTLAANAPNPFEVVKTTTTLLKSHTTTLSLLLITPPLTPSAIVTKIGDVSSGVLSSMVAAVGSIPQPGQRDELGDTMRGELRAQVRWLLGTWNDVLTLVRKVAERRVGIDGKGEGKGKRKDEGPTETEKQEVLAATGVVWEACDALLKTCEDGVVGLIVKKANEWRSVLLDAVAELKEWGEDVEEDGEDELKGSGDEDAGFAEEDEIFGAVNKLGKLDEELKRLLETSVKRLKMVGILYQALIKRRLKTFPRTLAPPVTTNGEGIEARFDPIPTLNLLMVLLKTIPETVDDLASAFYDLDEAEAKKTLELCCIKAKGAVKFTFRNWVGQEDEFTAWSTKWINALDAS